MVFNIYSWAKAQLARAPRRKLIAAIVAFKVLGLLVMTMTLTLGVWPGTSGARARAAVKQQDVSEQDRAECAEHFGVFRDIGHKVGYDKERICVTHVVYMDLEQNGSALGRLEIALFGTVVPLSVANFAALATCEMVSENPPSNDHLCYHRDAFHRILPGFVAQGGSHATGKSIYGGTFSEMKEPKHHSFLSHASRGVVAWAEFPIGSQFYITLSHDHDHGPSYLDANHVVFGYVIAGANVLDLLDTTPLDKEKPRSKIWISDSGLLPVGS